MAHIKLVDRIQAEILTVGSRIGEHVTWAAQKIGTSDLPFYVPAQWQFDRHQAANSEVFQDEWLVFNGIPQAGRTPARYPGIAKLAFDRAQVDAYVEQTNGVHAIAYQLGMTAIMVGTSQNEIFGEDPDSKDNYAVGARIGKGDLRALAGIWNGHASRFEQVPNLQILGSIVDVSNKLPQFPVV